MSELSTPAASPARRRRPTAAFLYTDLANARRWTEEHGTGVTSVTVPSPEWDSAARVREREPLLRASTVPPTRSRHVLAGVVAMPDRSGSWGALCAFGGPSELHAARQAYGAAG